MARVLEARGYTISRIGRSGPDARWEDTAAVDRLVDGADLLVNLAGKSVDCRYTDDNRAEVLNSRVRTTRQLHGAVARAARPPRVWLNASTATIYRHAMDRPMTEQDGVIGSGFSVDVARSWEDELFRGTLPDTRRVALRIAIVLGDGPATRMLFRLAQLGLGGPQIDGWWFPHSRYRGIGADPSGSRWSGHHRTRGRQRFSWVHVEDVAESIGFLADDTDLTGPVNIAAPEPSDNRTVMAELRRAVGRRLGLPAFRFMLEPAMFVLRTEPELVLKSRWVLPERLDNAGYRFRHRELRAAVEDVAGTLGVRRRGR